MYNGAKGENGMIDKIGDFLKKCGWHLAAALALLYAVLWLAEVVEIAEKLVRLAEALLSSAVVAVGVFVGFLVWLTKRYDAEIRNFMRRFKRGKFGGAEVELMGPQAAGLAREISKDALPDDALPDEIRKNAEAGDIHAQFQLGLMFYFGRGVEVDKAEAVKWFRRAAEQGDVVAQCRLGVAYYKGEGVPEDKAEAAKWYRRAAEQGQALAQHMLGLLYRMGEGVPQSHRESYIWLSLAVASGGANAGEANASEGKEQSAKKLSPDELAAAQAEAVRRHEEIRARQEARGE